MQRPIVISIIVSALALTSCQANETRPKKTETKPAKRTKPIHGKAFFQVSTQPKMCYVGLSPAGSFPPNGFGIYDMIGNAWEWTSSPYYSSHASGETEKLHPDGYDPVQGKVPVGVIKGGSFLCNKSYCYPYRPAARQAQDLIFGTSHVSFRIVRD